MHEEKGQEEEEMEEEALIRIVHARGGGELFNHSEEVMPTR